MTYEELVEEFMLAHDLSREEVEKLLEDMEDES